MAQDLRLFRLHGVARVKNEGDVIEEFVRHNLRVLDHLTVIDNASLDGTREVLEQLRADGRPLAVLDDPIIPKRQSEVVTRFARDSVQHDAWDYLFLLDADEMLRVPSRSSLEVSLSLLPIGMNGLIAWDTYVPTPQDDPHERRVTRRLRHRRTVERTPYYKSVLARSFAAAGDFTVAQGNHTVFDARGEQRAALLGNVRLAHFPVRTVAQLQAKALLGWGAYLAMGSSGTHGWHQRRLFEQLEAGVSWTADDLYTIAMSYADDSGPPDMSAITYDPLAPVEASRYADVSITNPVQMAARYVRQIATALAESHAIAEVL